jgi:phosphoesterase RecJ-like protein
MKSVSISAFFREIEDDCWKVSLRSKGEINVAAIASSFDGGGHKNAAGYVIKATLEDAKASLLRSVSEHASFAQNASKS